MCRKQNLLHVRSYIEQTVKTCNEMLTQSEKYPTGLRLAPIDVDHLKEMRLIGEAILNKHSKKKTRKDIYVETPRPPLTTTK